MRIKTRPGLRPAFPRLTLSRAALGAGAAALGLAAFLLGALAHKHFIIRDVLKPAWAENFRIPLNFVSGLFASPEHLTVDIKHRHYLDLAFQRKQALEAGVLMPGVSRFVPASITHRGTTYPAKVRLKGFFPDHWGGETGWSLRARLKSGAALFGMRELSLQHPKTRTYLNEWVFQRLLRRVGVLGPRYEFVSVTQNGRRLGVYALEEGLDKNLVEASGRREGPILRFNEELHWFDINSTHPYQTYVTSDIDAFQSKSLTDAAQLERFLRAKDLLESYRSRKLPASKVFDVEKMARFFAVLDLIGNPHPAEFHNMAFYYNPVLGLLEPVGRDGDIYKPLIPNVSHLLGAARPAGICWEESLMEDPLFAEKYAAAMEELSDKAWLDRFFAEIEPDYRRALRVLHKSYPLYSFRSSKALLYANQRALRQILRPPKAIQPYLRSYDPDTRVLTLEVANIQAMPVRLGPAAAGAVSLPLRGPALLAGKPNFLRPEYARASFSVPPSLKWSTQTVHELSVSWSLAGSAATRSERVFPWPHLSPSFPGLDRLTAEANVGSFPFLSVSGRRVVAKPGVWKVNRDLIIPPGVEFMMGPGTELVLSKSASIISRSPLRWVGSPERPAVVRSDGTGGGIAVLGDDRPSELQHVLIAGLAVPKQRGWGLVGSVNIHRSPIVIQDSSFSGNKDGDDLLNLIHSTFTIQRVRFAHSFADAVDLDFSDGFVVDSDFRECGVKDGNGDCLDVSGSRVNLQNVTMDGAGDKGLSVGENSEAKVWRLTVRRAGVGVAVKDLSRLHLRRSAVSDSPVGLATYQKKPEFGPSRVIATGLSMSKVKAPYLIEDKSSVTVDGAAIAAGTQDALSALYGEARTKRQR